MRKAINECVRHWTEVHRFTPWMTRPFGTIRTEIDEMWDATWYEAQILAPYKDKFECRECDCCCELWAECRCVCHNCGDDYNECRSKCYDSNYDEDEHIKTYENE